MEQIQVTGPTHRCNGVNAAEHHGTSNKCTICGEYRNGYYDAGGMEVRGIIQQPDARLVETFEVHVANCDKCGNGNLNQCATGQALKEDAYPSLPHPRDQAAQIVKAWRATDQTDGLLCWYIQQAIQDNVTARADSVSPSACQKCWEHAEREAAVCPEDVGCIEYIGILERQRDSLVKTLEGRAALEMECLNEAGMEIDSLRAALNAIQNHKHDKYEWCEVSQEFANGGGMDRCHDVIAHAALTKVGEQEITHDK